MSRTFLQDLRNWFRAEDHGEDVTLAPLDTTPAELEAFRHNMGLDRPVPIQYVDFLLHDNDGTIRKSLRPFFPDDRHAACAERGDDYAHEHP